MDGHAGADVLTEHADVGRQAAAGDFMASENLDQLLLATGGVLGGEHFQAVAALAEGGAHGSDGLGLVVFDANQHCVGLDQLHQDVDAADQCVGFFAHQQVVGGDVRLALRTVDDQGVNLLLRAGGEFDCRGEASAAEAADAGLANFFQQLRGFQVAIVRAGLQGGPLLQAVAVEHDGRRRQARNMGEGLRAYGADGAGGRCMHRHADQTVGGGE